MAVATFLCAPPTAVFASPTVSSTLPSAFNLSLPVRSPTACLTLPLAWSIFPSRSSLFHMACSNRCWRADVHRNSMRQTASERLCTSEHPDFSADGVDGPGGLSDVSIDHQPELCCFVHPADHAWRYDPLDRTCHAPGIHCLQPRRDHPAMPDEG